jgi:uncharacterized protein YyaL (SSP411 family)
MTLMNNAELLQAMVEIVIVGPPDDPATHALIAAVHARALPDKVIRLLSPDMAVPAGHPASGKGMIDGRPAAYVCRDMACSMPLTNHAELTALLDRGTKPNMGAEPL